MALTLFCTRNAPGFYSQINFVLRVTQAGRMRNNRQQRPIKIAVGEADN